MTRKELVDELAKRSGMPSEMARRAVDALFGSSAEAGSISQALQRGEAVRLTGFGTFEAALRGERHGRNPSTQESLVIPACRWPRFRASRALKKQVGTS